MTWIALRRVKLRGTQYEKGEEVPGADLRNRRMLVATGYIVDVPDAPPPKPEPEPEPNPEPADDDVDSGEAEEAPSLTGMKRADLNAYAAEIGMDDPEGYPNREALIAAIEDRLAAPDDDDGGTA
jgi:hypothetical protein